MSAHLSLVDRSLIGFEDETACIVFYSPAGETDSPLGGPSSRTECRGIGASRRKDVAHVRKV
jgi:hypothetical protein